jgi:hypothetical protein
MYRYGPIFSLVLFFLLGCEEDPINSEQQLSNRLENSWQLKQTNLFFGGTIDFQDCDVVYTFDSNANLEVDFPRGVQPMASPNHSGSSTYTISGTDSIFIGQERYRFRISNDTLIMEQSPESDGPRYVFVDLGTDCN